MYGKDPYAEIPGFSRLMGCQSGFDSSAFGKKSIRVVHPDSFVAHQQIDMSWAASTMVSASSIEALAFFVPSKSVPKKRYDIGTKKN